MPPSSPKVLKKFYTVYDAEHKRIGFGRARHPPAPAPARLEAEERWWLEAEEELAEEEENWEFFLVRDDGVLEVRMGKQFLFGVF